MDEPNQSGYRRRSQVISKSVSVPIVTSPSPTDENKTSFVTPSRRASEPATPPAADGLLKGEFVETVSYMLSEWPCLLIAEDTSGLSPAIPRTKSTSATRRKPKEKRRSTGIPTEVQEIIE